MSKANRICGKYYNYTEERDKSYLGDLGNTLCRKQH